MRDIGLEAIEARCYELASRLRAGVVKIPGCKLTGPSDSDAACGLASIAVEGWQPSQVVDALWQRWRIAVRAVAAPPAIRVSCGPFNIESDVDALLDGLRTLTGETPPPEAPAAH
jgi:selenocysteine lyase/cysteine desulfurase